MYVASPDPNWIREIKSLSFGSGCGSIGRAVASAPKVRVSYPLIAANFYIRTFIFYCQLYWKDKNKEIEAGNGPFFKKN